MLMMFLLTDHYIRGNTMKKQLGLILIFAVLLIGFSGCIFKGNDDNNGSSGMPTIPVDNVSEIVALGNSIPSGFEYLGSRSLTSDDVNKDYAKAENVLEASEGIYKSTAQDYYIIAIKFSDITSAESFIANYKSTFKVLNNNETFQLVEFNEHEATRALSYSTVGGKQAPRYKYFWSNDRIVFIIEGNSDDPTIGLDFAKATGY